MLKSKFYLENGVVMAKKNEVSVERGSKYEAIRAYCAAHPEAGPTVVANALGTGSYEDYPCVCF